MTLIPASIVKGEDIRDTTQTVSAANGTDIAILGKVSLPFSVGEYSGTLSGLVSEHVGEVMLGIGWMEGNAVTWELELERGDLSLFSWNVIGWRERPKPYKLRRAAAVGIYDLWALRGKKLRTSKLAPPPLGVVRPGSR